MIYEVAIDDRLHQVELIRVGAAWRCKVDGREVRVDAVFFECGGLSILIDGKSYEVKLETAGKETSVVVSNERFRAAVRDPRSLRSRRGVGDSAPGVKKLTAPMPGKVVRILTPAGAEVEAGQPVLVIEAMKMQNEVKSPKRGIVKRLAVGEGAAVEAGQTLAEVE